MNVPQEELDRWRRIAEQLRVRSLDGGLTAASGDRAAQEKAWREIHTASVALSVALDRAGAQSPNTLKTAAPIPLRLLDTPSNRTYLLALQNAHTAALDVDSERYGPVADGPAAGAIEDLIDDVEMEIFGPRGQGERG